MTQPDQLAKRERAIMDLVYQLGEASATEVAQRMVDSPGYDSVRVTLGILEKKGHVSHRKDGRRNMYRPAVPRERATREALRRLTKTFFKNSPSRAILTMLDLSSNKLTRSELDQIAQWIEEERKAK